jgi:hypothetical protein
VGGSWKIGLGRTMQGRRAVFDRRLESFAEVGWRCVGSFSQSIGAVTCCEWIKRRAAIDVRVTMPDRRNDKLLCRKNARGQCLCVEYACVDLSHWVQCSAVWNKESIPGSAELKQD